MIQRTALICCLALPALPPQADPLDSPPVTSAVETTAEGELVLTQEVHVRAPIAAAWAAYTTEDGWTSWASPVAAIDLRTGGTIRTHYDANAAIGDEGTNTLHIVHFVPERLLTLKADLSDNWPEFMREDAEHLANVIVFDELEPGLTRIRSFGVGYRDTAEYTQLLEFFVQANEGLLHKLVEVLEQ